MLMLISLLTIVVLCFILFLLVLRILPGNQGQNQWVVVHHLNDLQAATPDLQIGSISDPSCSSL
jgi:hypothetical protein